VSFTKKIILHCLYRGSEINTIRTSTRDNPKYKADQKALMEDEGSKISLYTNHNI